LVNDYTRTVDLLNSWKREENERENLSIEAFPEHGARWSWGDVRRQTVLEAGTIFRKRMTADSGNSCTSGH